MASVFPSKEIKFRQCLEQFSYSSIGSLAAAPYAPDDYLAFPIDDLVYDPVTPHAYPKNLILDSYRANRTGICGKGPDGGKNPAVISLGK